MAFDYDEHVALLRQMAARVDVDLGSEEILRRAAVWLTVSAWRRSGPLEDWHSQRWGPSQGEMMQLNVSTARIIRRHLSFDGSDWKAIATELVAPGRLLPSGKRLSRMLTPSRRYRLRDHIESMMEFYERVEALAGAEVQLKSYASGPTNMWFWAPGWTDHVERVRQVVSNPDHSFWRIGTWSSPPHGVDQLIAGLLAGPDTMSPEEADWYGRNYLGMVH